MAAAIYMAENLKRSLEAVPAVPDISGGRLEDYAHVFVFLWEMLYLNTCNNDKNLSEIQLEHEKEDELVPVVTKVEIENGLLEEVEKFGWWFEQDIDDEREEVKEDEDGGEV
ncbi:hypothetical protein Tco_0530000 [Tanacetum coccineum]